MLCADNNEAPRQGNKSRGCGSPYEAQRPPRAFLMDGETVMRKRTELLIFFILACGCLSPGLVSSEEEGQTNNFVEQRKAGMILQVVDNKIVVKGVVPNSPAEKAGVIPGGVILTVDGLALKSLGEIVDHIGAKRKGEHVVIVVERNGEKHTYDFEPVMIKVRRTLAAIQSLLSDNKKVVLAVVVSDVRTTFDMKKDVYDSWVEGVRNNEQTGMESFYLQSLGTGTTFSIVDRSRTKAILEEFKLGQTGLVSDTLRAKIGEMTGATHLLDVTFSRFKIDEGYDDVLNARLIDINTGAVLAVDQIRQTPKKK
jgi:membrane-associated protease RseP (regulator of RpoE activity)